MHSLLAGPSASQALARALDELANFNDDSTVEPRTDDRWILSSNLQKAIRRGAANIAVGTAKKLLRIDSTYLWRRLVVIAYEDIGLADADLCLALLKTFRRERLHEEQGASRIAAYFAKRLANAPKSRLLCQLVVCVECDQQRPAIEEKLRQQRREDTFQTVVSEASSMLKRGAALRHVAGYRIVSLAGMAGCQAADRDAMTQISDRFELSDAEATLYRCGQGASDGMNAMVPLAVEVFRKEAPTLWTQPLPTHEQSGTLLAAVDQHTRMGKRCIAQLAIQEEALLVWLAQQAIPTPLAALGAAVFLVEGSLLDKQLKSESQQAVEAIYARNYLESTGIASYDQNELLARTKESLVTLSSLRRTAIASAS